MKYSIFIIFLFLIFSSCSRKGIEADKLYIRGRLFLLDTLVQGSKGIPLGHRGVTIAKGVTDTVNFLYSDTTDKDGYFVFTIMTDDRKENFLIKFEDTIGGYYYKGMAPAVPSADTVSVIATLDQSKQNGFVMRLFDENGQLLPGCTIRLYNNATLAARNDSSGAGAVLVTTADPYGTIFKFNLPAGDYYINGERSVDMLIYQRLSKFVHIDTYGFKNDTMVLKQRPSVDSNGFVITVMDSLGGAVPFASANLYTSQVLAVTNDSDGAFKTYTAGADGIIREKNIQSGNYFLSALKKLDTVTYIRLAKPIAIPSHSILTDSIALFKKRS